MDQSRILDGMMAKIRAAQVKLRDANEKEDKENRVLLNGASVIPD